MWPFAKNKDIKELHTVLLSLTLSKSQCTSNIPPQSCNRTSFSSKEASALEMTVSSSTADSAVIWEIKRA